MDYFHPFCKFKRHNEKNEQGGIRTPDTVVRSHVLWSTELQALFSQLLYHESTLFYNIDIYIFTLNLYILQTKTFC